MDCHLEYFSEDPEKCDRVSKALDAGICFKNCYRFISYAASFGGRKIVVMGEKVELTLLLTCKLEKQFGHQTLE